MITHYSPIYYIHYFLKRKADQFFASISIRYLAIGMISIFEPIYIYLFFSKSMPYTLLFFGAIYGLYGLLAVYGGKLISKIGAKNSMLLSHFFFFGYFVCLFFIYNSNWLIFLAIMLKSIGMMCFWPSFHTDFTRFSEQDHRGSQVGKLNIAQVVPMVISPIIGGIILSKFGYHVLFTAVLCVLLASVIPLFLSKETHELYTDSYKSAWERVFSEDKKISIAIVADGLETIVNIYFWPLFMFVLAIKYKDIGGITSAALAISIIFSLYIGKLSDRINRIKILKIGSILTSISWLIKYFVASPLNALVAQSFYRISRIIASIPLKTVIYENAAERISDADEFIIYREIILNSSRALFLAALAAVFSVCGKINMPFLFAAILSLLFILIGSTEKLRLMAPNTNNI